MKATQILEAMRAAGAAPRLVNGVVVTWRIENRRLAAVFRDAVDRIAELLVKEEQRVNREAA
jgi:multidrug efflux pump subunit AcrA (membrane-fusion protein)